MQKHRSLGYALASLLTVSYLTAAKFPQENLPQKKISLCGQNYLAWVASKEEDRTRGLMNFRALKKAEAMLFVFENEQPLSFWMKNVSYDLDIAYFNKSKKLVSYTTMKGTTPMMNEGALPAYPSGDVAQFAVEVSAGHLKKLKKGCRLVF